MFLNFCFAAKNLLLGNLPVFGAEPRSGEAKIAFQKDENLTMLRTLDKIRKYFRENPDAEF